MQAMETVIFWIIWGLLSFFLLRRFYYVYNKNDLARLRLFVLTTEVFVLILFFAPWISSSFGTKSGWDFFKEGEIGIVTFFTLLLISILLFISLNKLLLKIASSIHILSSILFFIIMIRLRPGTFKLTLNDFAPIIAALMLLIGDVIVLLLWQQLQLKEKRKKRH